MRWIVEHDLGGSAAVVQQKGDGAPYRYSQLMKMTVCMLTPMHVTLRGEYVIHAPDDEGYVAIFFQRDEHAAVVTMLQQMDSFDFHVLGLAVDSLECAPRD
jgi:hypothetical protein